MKKKVLVTLLLSTTLVFTACGNSKTDEQTVQETPTITESPNATITDTPEITGQEDASQAEELSLDGLESTLLEKGLLKGEKTPVAAEMIGAKAGFKYADSETEVYEYDTSSEQYKKFTDGEEVELEGMEGFSIKSSAINGKFVLIFSNDSSNDDILNAFNSYK